MMPGTDEQVLGERMEAVRAILDAHATMTLATVHDAEPWAGKVFFVGDLQSHGRLDLCCALMLPPGRFEGLRSSPRVAFVIAGDLPDRWVQGTGNATIVDDPTDGQAIRRRLRECSTSVDPFLERIDWSPVRVRVDRIRFTDMDASPPVAEIIFA